MSFYLIIKEDSNPFTIAELRAAGEGIIGVTGMMEPGSDSIFSIAFTHDSDDIIAEMDQDRKALFINDRSDSAIQFAIKLQEHLNCDLRLIDSGYNFDIKISNYGSLEGILDKISSDDPRDPYV